MIKFIDILRESIEDDEYGYDADHKITPETIKKIKPTDRIVLGTEDKLDLSRSYSPSKIGYKPTGLWYGFGTSWIDYIRSEGWNDRETHHVFKIEIENNSTDMINVDSEKMFLWFSNRYKKGEPYEYKIDWPEVSKKYKG